MKTDRQKLILELISGQSVATQQQLLELLAARGVQCTQATLSTGWSPCPPWATTSGSC